ncbi:MAG: DUF5937 family protein [Lapillicoccus sp.]
MLEFTLSPALLGHTRFAFSPLAEVGASIRLLGLPQKGHVHQPWIMRARTELDGAVDMALLAAACPPSRWPPDYLFAPPEPSVTTIEDQLHQLRGYPPERFAADLAQAWQGQHAPRRVSALLEDPDRALSLLADALSAYWAVAIHPHWPRICGVLEDDVAHRATRSLAGGLYDLLEDLHPEIAIRDLVLTVDKPAHCDEVHAGTVLTLVPSVFLYPHLIVSHDESGRLSATYTARGVGRVWHGQRERDHHPDDTLGSLLGPTRARILRRLDVPMTTTTTARHLQLTPSNVSQHLAVLRDNGLLRSWRSGRDVLYTQTTLAQSLIGTTGSSASRGTG